MRSRVLMALAFSAALGCGSGGGGGSSSSGTNQNPTSDVLGILPSEANYADNAFGIGGILLLEDNTLSFHGLATIENGQRIIYLNGAALAALPISYRRLILFHEIGHHFADHHHRYSACYYAESEANAYAARVQFFFDGSLAVLEAANVLQAANCPPDATHPNCFTQASHIREVLATVEQDPAISPVIHFPRCGPATTGFLRLFNPLQEPVFTFVNGGYVGDLFVCQSGTLTGPPALYRLDVQGQFTGFPVFLGNFPILLGEMTIINQRPPFCRLSAEGAPVEIQGVCGGLVMEGDWEAP